MLAFTYILWAAYNLKERQLRCWKRDEQKETGTLLAHEIQQIDAKAGRDHTEETLTRFGLKSSKFQPFGSSILFGLHQVASCALKSHCNPPGV